ncbi:MAG: glycosyltransferase family 1 protein [Pseudobdellovibrionaceae bacterium]
MKILIISDAWLPQVNGVVRTYQHLMPELEALGHDVTVIGPHDFPYHFPLPFYREIDVAVFTKQLMRRKISAYGPDLVHIATEGPLGKSARQFCMARGQPFTTCYHTHFPDYVAKRMKGPLRPFAKPARAMTYNHLRKFHAPSRGLFVATPTLQSHLQEKGFSAPFYPMTRGIDARIFHEGEKTLFEDLKKPVALFVGRVATEKNIEAFLDTPWEGTKVVVGSGPDLEELRAAYPDTVFMGRKEGRELADCYRSADVFVFPSRTDTFGMVIVEALSCGLPVAGYPVQGPIDIITAPMLGAVHDSLETAMRTALASSGTREERAAYARNTYSWQEAANQFLAVCDSTWQK